MIFPGKKILLKVAQRIDQMRLYVLFKPGFYHINCFLSLEGSSNPSWSFYTSDFCSLVYLE